MTDVRFIKKRSKIPVHLVRSTDDDSVLIAMNLLVANGYAHWFDTIKERKMKISKIIDARADHFVFKKENGGQYTFTPLTLAVYQNEVKRQLIRGMDFNTEEEMIVAFKETRKHAW